MLEKLSVVVFLILLLSSGGKACVDPMSPYSVGVVFSGGEDLYPERIESVAQESASYLKECTLKEATKGFPILVGTNDSCAADPLTVTGVSVAVNTLTIEVGYSGGCEEHSIDLYTDKLLLESDPPQINLWLSHNAHGDMCEAYISQSLRFDLTSLEVDVNSLYLRIYEPGRDEFHSSMPLWHVASGQKTQQCSYKLRSAYEIDIMAHVGYFDGPLQHGGDGFRVLLIFDTTEVPTAAVKAEALYTELLRLKEIGVIALTVERMEHFKAALSQSEGQYWTAEDTVLPFNSWFDGSSVNGVKGVYGTRGCGSGVDYELPAIAFESTGTKNLYSKELYRKGKITTAIKRNGMQISFPPVSGNGSALTITAMNGRRVAVYPLGEKATVLFTGASENESHHLSAGCYMLSLIDKGRTVQTGSMVITGH
jgi:hypothetical protein